MGLMVRLLVAWRTAYPPARRGSIPPGPLDWRLAMKEDIGFTLNALFVLLVGAGAVALTAYVVISNIRVAFGLY